MKKVLATITVLVVAAITAVAAVGCGNKDEVFKRVESGSRPEGDAIVLSADRVSDSANLSDYVTYGSNGKIASIKLPTENNAQGMKMVALALYRNGNQLDKEVPCRRGISYCPTSTKTMGMTVYVDTMVYTVKNGTEWIMNQYQIPRIESDLVKKILASFGAKATGMRSYYNLTMDKKAMQTVDNASFDDNQIPYSDWNGASTNYVDQIPIFNVAQEKEETMTDIVINENTIKSAKVSYNNEKGIFNAEIVLDAGNPETSSLTIDSLRAGAGDDAYYTSIVETIEFWDNGYYKYFLSTDCWATKTIQAILPYETTFSYAAADCVIADYDETVEFKAILGQN